MSPRQLAFFALKDIFDRQAYTNIAIDRILQKYELKSVDRGLFSELVYGIVRRKRTLDSLIEQFSQKKITQQPPNLRIILQIGLYQLRYLTHIPESAAVNTTVDLAKINDLGKLTGVVNGILRNYLRQSKEKDPLILPSNLTTKLGILYSFPDWIIDIFQNQLEVEEIEKLCIWFNQPATVDLRINILKTTKEEIKNKLLNQNIQVTDISDLPQSLRLNGHIGNIQNLEGFADGLYSIQDSSAQLVSHLLDPKPHEMVIDACAAPGSKTTHIAELMNDTGIIISGDRHKKKLTKIQENITRLQLKSIKIQELDASQSKEFENQADKVLIDVPCSGLGTLHKRPDIRWKQNLKQIEELNQQQQQIINNASKWVKIGGKLVYSTCTLNPTENEEIIKTFLANHPNWGSEKPENILFSKFLNNDENGIKIYPHRHNMDGFFMIKLKRLD